MHDEHLTGRIGRYMSQRRLETARRAVDLLDRKLRILMVEQERCRLQAARTLETWQRRATEAERRATVVAMLGGQRTIRLATPVRPARLAIDWAQVMGVRYPVSVVTDTLVAQPPPVGSAVAAAHAAVRAALLAAADAAAAAAAARTIDNEVSETRRRRHAIADRRIPQLEGVLHTLIQRLEEDERADTVRLRWAVQRPEGRA
jgi:V/A-type H+/Na+-transporting ATPase subunit D